MSLAKKLREVVAANFIEIARVDTPPAKPDEKPAPAPEPVDILSTAEAELDSYLKDIESVATDVRALKEAPPAAVAPAARVDTSALAEALAPSLAEPPKAIVPEPIAVAEPVAPQAGLRMLVDAVSDAGDIDFDRVYKHYALPKPSFSAEQAMNMLQALPRDLPLRTKRITVNTTLSAIGQVVGATPKDIVDDAMRKRRQLENYLVALADEISDSTAGVEAEIGELQRQIAEKRESLRLLNRKGTAANEVCQSRMQLFEQVVHFFDYDESTLNSSAPQEEAAHAEPDDMPAFMREDAVRRMLGITEDDGGEFDPVKFAAMYGTGDDDGPANGATDGSDAQSRSPRRRNGARHAEPVS